MQLLTGSDVVGNIPLEQAVPAGSSKTEPGITPANNITFVFNKWSEVQDACGQSRLHGGMHFTRGV